VTPAQLAAWKGEMAGGNGVWMHGLWDWNWADSHRPVLDVNLTAGVLTVGDDDYNHDVNPIKKGGANPTQQGGNVYAYNLLSELDAPGEYHIDKAKASLAFIPPAREPGEEGASASTAREGTYHVSRLEAVVVATGASNITLSNLEIRHARGGGVLVVDSVKVVLRGCTVADCGSMGVNITRGSSCGVQDSDVSNNGDAGVVMFGGDRTTLTPSGHYVANCTVHHNQRWVLNYAPNILMGGVGQRVSATEVYGAPQIGVFVQGNDHTLEDSDMHDLTRECSDCGAFYAGRDWTYRGNTIIRTRFSKLASVFGAGWSSPSAVYLDDQLSSVAIRDCVFDHHHGMVLELGGGRHNEFTGNVIKGNLSTLHFDNRGGDGSRCVPGIQATFLQRVPYNTSKAWARYPGLANILDDEPCTPAHNVISNNILCEGATSRSFGLDPAKARGWNSTMENNTVVAAC